MKNQNPLIVTIILSLIGGAIIGSINAFLPALSNIVMGLIAAVIIFALLLANQQKISIALPTTKHTGDRVKGVIKWYDNRKRYGFIQYEGVDYFFHGRGITGQKRPAEKDQVEFVIDKGPKGEQAYHVKILTKAKADAPQTNTRPNKTEQTENRGRQKNKPTEEKAQKASTENAAIEKNSAQESNKKVDAENRPKDNSERNFKKKRRSPHTRSKSVNQNTPKTDVEYNADTSAIDDDDAPQPGNSINEPPAHNKSSLEFNYRSLNYPNSRKR